MGDHLIEYERGHLRILRGKLLKIDASVLGRNRPCSEAYRFGVAGRNTMAIPMKSVMIDLNRR